jgi:hypothetical protein
MKLAQAIGYKITTIGIINIQKGAYVAPLFVLKLALKWVF